MPHMVANEPPDCVNAGAAGQRAGWACGASRLGRAGARPARPKRAAPAVPDHARLFCSCFSLEKLCLCADAAEVRNERCRQLQILRPNCKRVGLPQPLCGVFGPRVVGDHAGAFPAALRHDLMRGRAIPTRPVRARRAGSPPGPLPIEDFDDRARPLYHRHITASAPRHEESVIVHSWSEDCAFHKMDED